MSKDKLHSNYDSVQEQTGIFAGKGGFDVKVGEHTQLDGAVIASTADKSKNNLDTGTLGFSNIENKADFKAEHQGGSLSTGGPVGSDLLSNLGSVVLSGLGNDGHADGTTQSAVSDGTITIRDTGKQQQNVDDLSRDTDNANGSIGPIFDKEKEQNRLREAQLIGEIGGQAMDIARTQGDIIGLEAALKANPTLKGDAEALRETKEYKAEMQKYGTGSALQQGIQAATAAVQGLAGGDMAKALAGASAPYLAEVIKKSTGDNQAANLMAHAVLGAVVAQVNGNSALAGASGAAMGEYIAQQMYPGINREDLTEEQRQTISALGTLAAGLAGGVVGNSTADAVAGAQAGKNAVENNYLSSTEKSRQTYLNNKQNLTPEEQKDKEALNRKDLESDLAAYAACSGEGGDCQVERAKAKDAQDTYFNQTYQNPKEAQAGYQQIMNLLNSTDPNAKEVFNILEGYTQAFMSFGYTEDEAKARAGAYVGSMYIAGGVSAVVASGALTKQFGKDVALNNKGSASGAASSLVKNADGIYEVKVNVTPLEGHDRLNTPDLGGNGKLKPAEAASAAQLEPNLGTMERYTPPPGMITDKTPDFVITSGPNKGKTVDAMYTTDRLSQKEIDGLNKFYEKNMVSGNGQKVIQDHLQKADFVPVDFRVLTPANQNIFMNYIKTLPKVQQDKIIIMR